MAVWEAGRPQGEARELQFLQPGVTHNSVLATARQRIQLMGNTVVRWPQARGAGKSTSGDAQLPDNAAHPCQGSERVHAWARCHPCNRDRGRQPRHGPAAASGTCAGVSIPPGTTAARAHRRQRGSQADGSQEGQHVLQTGNGERAPPFVPSTRAPTLAAAPRVAKMQLERCCVPAQHQAASHSARILRPSRRAQRCPGTHRRHPGPTVRGDTSGGWRQKAPRCWQLARGGGVAVRKTCEGCV